MHVLGDRGDRDARRQVAQDAQPILDDRPLDGVLRRFGEIALEPHDRLRVVEQALVGLRDVVEHVRMRLEAIGLLVLGDRLVVVAGGVELLRLFVVHLGLGRFRRLGALRLGARGPAPRRRMRR